MRPRVLLCVPVILLLSAPLRAQIPDTFTNLKVLPEDISRAELIGTMRGFSFALGVRCHYCHMVSDGLNDEADDFASDEKPTKLRARVMMEMVRAINQDFLSRLPDHDHGETVEVQCRTCHRGIEHPRMLEDVLFDVTLESGIGPAMARYQELHERYYGRAAYDFGPRTFFLLGEKLVDAGHPREGIAVFNRVLEDDPESTEAWMNIGAAQAAAGDTESAIRAYQRVIELSPTEGWGPVAERRIAELRAKQDDP